ncbi:hypothetical protein AUK40_04345 [Candidatus Wirthbacteria bacterium CG2_30_54_11]|uniref:ATP-grasp domain-containing protein n=1 Tax=Candidatus Wirthbacteria bacterium CG2_30_54_11 TaxID=1817892 RepID=A0A1J5IR62_9BACT|nr:MAG: hypothetical protein AUK40_04345 [Candidatus Wirthbacteria bacterium CG2_30_54_11]
MLDMFFSPKSLAVIGASKDETKVGHIALRNIVKGGFKGKIYPINPKESEILGLKCYPSVKNVRAEIDLGVVVVPAKFVLDVVKECAEKKLKGLIIISAGFKETGKDGADVEKEMGRIAREAGMRIIGPNCLGLMDTKSKLNASFVGELPPKGNVAFMSQSGALCSAVLDWSYSAHVGFSKFISVGNKVDIADPDLLNALEEDPETEVVMMYAEDILSERRFLQAAESLAKKKPLIALKSGCSPSGMKAISSHTGSLAGDDVAYTLAFKQTGGLRCKTIEHLFIMANAFSKQPVIQGKRVAIVTNAGGPGVMTTDAIEERGLELAKLSEETQAALKSFLPAAANTHNPVDVLGDALPDRYGFAIEKVIADPNVDALIVILTPQAMTDIAGTARLVGEKTKGCGKPVLCCWMGDRDVRPAFEILSSYDLPNFPYPEHAVYALQKMVSFNKIHHEPVKNWIIPKDRSAHRHQESAAIIRQAQSEGRTSLNEFEARSIVKAYGVPVARHRMARTVDEAVHAAEMIGFPVALKIVSPDVLHKFDVGGVKISIKDEAGVRAGYEGILSSIREKVPHARIDGILVDSMVKGQRREIILGMKRNPQFGPMLMFGLGGIFVEVLKDVAFRLVPLTRDYALNMIEEIKSFKILQGVRGELPYDINSIADALIGLSDLVIDFPEIHELDVNPFMVRPEGWGAAGVDVKMLIE